MKRSTVLCAAATAAVTLLLCAPFAVARPEPDPGAKPQRPGPVGPRFVIRDTRLFDGRDVKTGMSILVEDGRITKVGKDVAASPGVTILDGKGLTVLPGLLDAHTHVFGDARKAALAFGVTTELDMFTAATELPKFRKDRESLSSATEADVFSAGILATAPKGHGTEYGMPIPTLTQASEADAWVAARVAEGSDYIKIVMEDGSAWGFTTPTLDRAVVGALVRAAHARKKLAVVHVSSLADARAALEEGADGLVHVFADAPADDAFVALVKKRDAFVVPTLTVLESISGGQGKVLADPDLSPFLPAGERQRLGQSFGKKRPKMLETGLESVRTLAKAGVPLLAGTDAANPGTAHGASLHRELELLVSAGLTPLEALRAATSVPAARFAIPERGLVAPGMRADLLVVEGDPTTSILATRKIVAIYKNGRFVPRERVEATAAAAAGAMPQGALGDFEDGSTKGGFGSGWQSTTDQLAGGASVAAISVVAGGASGTSKALRIDGEIKPGFPFPWAGAIFLPGTPPFAPVDASARRELVFHARGDGKTYRVMFFTTASRMPVERKFEAKEGWAEVRVPLSDLPNADWKAMQAVGFSAGGEAGAFRLEIDEVQLR